MCRNSLVALVSKPYGTHAQSFTKMIRLHGQATCRTIFSADLSVGQHCFICDVLDVAVKVMPMDDVVLSEKMRREANRLLAQIVGADSMIVAVKAGARADGFILGMEAAGGLRVGDAERLYIIIENAL